MEIRDFLDLNLDSNNPPYASKSVSEPSKTNNFEYLINDFTTSCRIYDYAEASNPYMIPIPIKTFNSDELSDQTQIKNLDISNDLGYNYLATSPNLLAQFIKIKNNDSVLISLNATSQVYYVIKGSGYSLFKVDFEENNTQSCRIDWSKGDLFVLPITKELEHIATHDTLMYSINDEPLLNYLLVKPSYAKFKPTIFKSDMTRHSLNEIYQKNLMKGLNRLGILLSNEITESTTKTLTHTMWSLLNILPANTNQRPHRHNSVALDLCVESSNPEKVYTLIGSELDENGWIINPIKCSWKKGSVFITPPGMWHSHHNETDTDALVLPVQDAGLYTYQQTLDIRFSV